MVLKYFRLQIILRIAVLTLSIHGFFFLIYQSDLYATIFIVGLFTLYWVYSLIRYVEKTNSLLSRFLLAVKHGDFSRTFTGKDLGPTFRELASLFNEVMEKIQETRSEKEEHYRYLQTILHHVGIGLITFREDGEVDLINTAAKRLLNVAGLKNVKSLRSFSEQLVETLFSLKAGEKALVKVDSADMELMVRAAEFRLHGQHFTLVSIQNIQSELQEKEMEAWQTLIRVLTHEIMNSMTPITSMAATVIDLLSPLQEKEERISKGIETFDWETIGDISNALRTIHKRSQGLTEFVSAYRNLTLIPKPTFKLFSIEELFSRVEHLMEVKFKEGDIMFRWEVEPQTLELTADPALIEQVLINLLLNALEAFHNGGKDVGNRLACSSNSRQGELRVELTAGLDEIGRVVIRVKDNGPGIVKEALGKVFIPFFTTKKRGSGIGLSLSRQIMKLHNGSISVHSDPDKETVFTLKF
jgi:two-component system nitrogen regulation sensor histidine kinase NtrY